MNSQPARLGGSLSFAGPQCLHLKIKVTPNLEIMWFWGATRSTKLKFYIAFEIKIPRNYFYHLDIGHILHQKTLFLIPQVLPFFSTANPSLCCNVENTTQQKTGNVLFFLLIDHSHVLLSIFFFLAGGLCWVFVATRGLSLVAVNGVYSSLWCACFSLWWLLLLRSTDSRHTGFSSCGT